jgi:hypothetical protein
MDTRDHDLLIQIDQRVQNIEVLLMRVEKRCESRGREIANLQVWKNRQIGAITVLGGAIGLVSGYFLKIFER